MKDQSKTKQVLIQELASLRQRIEELEQSEAVRKRAEETLRESEEKYRSLASTEDSMYLVDRDCRYLFMNERHLKRLGLSQNEIIGITYGEFHSGEDTSRFTKAVENVFETRESLLCEHRSERDNRNFLRTFSPVRSPDGKTTAVTVVSKDITNRKQMEEALRESEEKYSTLVQQAKDGVIIIQDNILKFANEAMANILGYTIDEIENTPYINYVAHESRAMVASHVDARVAGEDVPQFYEAKLLRKDGTIIYAELSANVIQLSGKPADVGIIRDITERKRAEAELLHLVTAIEQAAEGVYLTDTNWIIQYANPAFETMLGYGKGELIGWHARLLKSGKHDRIFYQNIRETLVSGKVWSGRGINKKKDGTFLDVDVTMSPVRDRSGNIINYVCIHRDITREIVLEAQLLQSQKMEAVGTLAGGIAHDFNNLLSAIVGHATLLKLEANLNSSGKERLERIEDLVKSGATMTRQLLDFARKGRTDAKPADMNQLLDRLVAMFGRTKREIAIHKKFEEKLWATKIDSGQIEQVFMNLFVNAWQAMPGGGNIYLETSNLTIHSGEIGHDYIVPGDYVKISVTDTGTGMDEATKTRLFEPFFTTKEIGRGTGLGLATVYGIIKGHDGYIAVYSEQGQGTTFNIYLPSTEKEASEEKERPREELVRGKENILLIDDEEEIIRVMEQMLKFLGYTVLVARSGQEGLMLYTHCKDKVDLVILDMIMPGMSGGETFGHLMEMNPHIKVILSSGYSANGRATDIMKQGCKEFIQKPVRIAELSQKIREVLKKKD